MVFEYDNDTFGNIKMTVEDSKILDNPVLAEALYYGIRVYPKGYTLKTFEKFLKIIGKYYYMQADSINTINLSASAYITGYDDNMFEVCTDEDIKIAMHDVPLKRRVDQIPLLLKSGKDMLVYLTRGYYNQLMAFADNMTFFLDNIDINEIRANVENKATITANSNASALDIFITSNEISVDGDLSCSHLSLYCNKAKVDVINVNTLNIGLPVRCEDWDSTSSVIVRNSIEELVLQVSTGSLENGVLEHVLESLYLVDETNLTVRLIMGIYGYGKETLRYRARKIVKEKYKLAEVKII